MHGFPQWILWLAAFWPLFAGILLGIAGQLVWWLVVLK